MGKKVVAVFFILFQMALLIGCGSSNGWGADAQYGLYKMNADDEYPCVLVRYMNWIDQSGNDTVHNWISVRADEYHKLDGEGIQKGEDGSYHITGEDYDYFIYFNGDGKIKVEMEKSEDANFASGVLKGTYKKAVGTYDLFKAYDTSIDEDLEKAFEALNN